MARPRRRDGPRELFGEVLRQTSDLAEVTTGLARLREFATAREGRKQQLMWFQLFTSGLSVAMSSGSMTFKVQKIEEESAVVLKLSGRLEKENVAELESLCEPSKTNALVLDLEEVKLVDRDVVEFLDRCEGEGVRLRNCPAYIRHWIAQEHKGKS